MTIIWPPQKNTLIAWTDPSCTTEFRIYKKIYEKVAHGVYCNRKLYLMIILVNRKY